MRALQFRITPGLLQAISSLERLTGKLERVPLADSAQAAKRARRLGAESAVKFEPRFSAAQHELWLEQYAAALEADLELSSSGFVRLAGAFFPAASGGSVCSWRKEPLTLTMPLAQSAREETLFPAVAPFLVEQRFGELWDWSSTELRSGREHPLPVIAAFHLVFLQISPFCRYNHPLALLAQQHLLLQAGYQFSAFDALPACFWNKAAQYCSVLRQAEKTAYTDWTTFNVWLDFFLQTLIGSATELLQKAESHRELCALTASQRLIVDIVRERGAVTRDTVTAITGIPESTVKYNLTTLAKRGFLSRRGGGRTTNYRLA